MDRIFIEKILRMGPNMYIHVLLAVAILFSHLLMRSRHQIVHN